MALDKTTLENALVGLRDVSDADAAAMAWAVAYNGYAQAAQDVSGDTLVAGNINGFYAPLKTLFESTNPPAPPAAYNPPNPLTAAQAFGNAFVGYWSGAMFTTLIPPAIVAKGTVGGNGIFAKEATSIVSLVTSVALVSALDGYFADPNTVTLKTIADTLHAATIAAVTVLITGVDTTAPTPLPITNTNTLY